MDCGQGCSDLDDLKAVPFLAALLADIEATYPDLEPRRTMHELVRRVITRFVEGAIAESASRLSSVRSAEEIRRGTRAVVAWPDALVEADRAIKAFLTPKMYRHPVVQAVREKAADVLRRLLWAFLADPGACRAIGAPALLNSAARAETRKARASSPIMWRA